MVEILNFINSLDLVQFLYYLLPSQDCMFENRDWRKCKEEMKSFKDCMEKNTKRAIHGAK